jgi:hypothetical protein
MIEGSGSVPLTNGSGSRRPKNIRILRIRIQTLQEIFNNQPFVGPGMTDRKPDPDPPIYTRVAAQDFLPDQDEIVMIRREIRL